MPGAARSLTVYGCCAHSAQQLGAKARQLVIEWQATQMCTRNSQLQESTACCCRHCWLQHREARKGVR